MEKSIEKNITRKIQTQLGKVLQEYGFHHTKTTFFVKKVGDWYQVIHIHKFSSRPSFRVHVALRHSYDPLEAVGLNGPNSDGYKEFKTDFLDNLESVDKCVEEMKRFTIKIGFPWFEDILNLHNENIIKKLGIKVVVIEANLKQTNKLLGIKTYRFGFIKLGN